MLCNFSFTFYFEIGFVFQTYFFETTSSIYLDNTVYFFPTSCF